jgi:hypothetical protein
VPLSRDLEANPNKRRGTVTPHDRWRYQNE